MSDKSQNVNNGFWDKTPEERSALMEKACQQNGVSNFFDLSPEERSKVYDEGEDD